MPSITRVISRFTKQVMVYWPKIGSDPFGKPAYGDPVEVKVRWEDKQKEIITAEGRKVVTKGYLLLSVPVDIGSWVFLGDGKTPTLDWKALPTYPALPTVNQGGREIIMVNSTPDIKARGFVYEAYL